MMTNVVLGDYPDGFKTGAGIWTSNDAPPGSFSLNGATCT